MGIDTRVAALQRAATCSERGVALEKAAGRLVDGAWMGSEYKVMGVTSGVGGGTEEVWPFGAAKPGHLLAIVTSLSQATLTLIDIHVCDCDKSAPSIVHLLQNA